MAKLTARGAHKIGHVQVSANDPDNSYEDLYWIYALRSDGAVLRKLVFVERMFDGNKYRRDGGYSIWASIQDPAKHTMAFLESALTRKGFQLR